MSKSVFRASLFWVESNKSILFAAALFLFLIIKAENGKHDFWEHAAAIKSLRTELLNPPHPYIKNSFSMHHFYSPYHVLLSQVGEVVGAKTNSVLIYAGFLNFAVFLILLYLFIAKLNQAFKLNDDTVYFFALLFILFWWGADLWMWSGFYHYKFLAEQVYMPSLTAFNLLLVGFLLISDVSNNRILRYLFFVLVFSISLLIHPNTTISFVPVFFAYHFRSKINCLDKDFIIKLFFTASAFLLTVLWPYFNFFDFVFSEDASYFNDDSYLFYSGLLASCWPGLLTLPILIFDLKSRKNNFFVLSFLGLMVIFSFGYVSGQFGLGRSISLFMIMVQINLAFIITRWYEKGTDIIHKVSIMALIFLTILAFNSKTIISKVAPQKNDIKNTTVTKSGCKIGGKPWLLSEMVPECIGADDQVITRLNLGRYFASVRGKYIAIDRPDYWIHDIRKRRDDIVEFHSIEACDEVRMRIIQIYEPDHILINKRSDLHNKALMSFLNRNFVVESEDDCLIVYSISSNFE